MEHKLRSQSKNPAQCPQTAQEQVSRANFFLIASQSLVLSLSHSLTTIPTIKSLIVALIKLKLLLFHLRLLSMMAPDQLVQLLICMNKVSKELPTVGTKTRTLMAHHRRNEDRRNNKVDIRRRRISMIQDQLALHHHNAP